MKKELYCRRVITVCPRKNGYGGISGHIWKCVRHIYDFIIWFIMSNTLKLLYKKIFGINQIVWNMRLWRWTQIKLGILNFCWVQLISQNSSRWKTYVWHYWLWVTQRSATQIKIGFGPAMANVSYPYLGSSTTGYARKSGIIYCCTLL